MPSEEAMSDLFGYLVYLLKEIRPTSASRSITLPTTPYIATRSHKFHIVCGKLELISLPTSLPIPADAKPPIGRITTPRSDNTSKATAIPTARFGSQCQYLTLTQNHFQEIDSRLEYYNQDVQNSIQFPKFLPTLKHTTKSDCGIEKIARAFGIAVCMLSGHLIPLIRGLGLTYTLLSRWKPFVNPSLSILNLNLMLSNCLCQCRLDPHEYYDKLLRSFVIAKPHDKSTAPATINDTDNTIWKVLSLIDIPKGLGCIAFTNVDSPCQLDDDKTILLQSELYTLILLLTRQIDPQRDYENFEIVIKDKEKGNGWVERSALLISFTNSHFRVIEARLDEGTLPTSQSIKINIKLILNWDWNEVLRLGDDTGGPEMMNYIWKCMLSYSIFVVYSRPCKSGTPIKKREVVGDKAVLKERGLNYQGGKTQGMDKAESKGIKVDI